MNTEMELLKDQAQQIATAVIHGQRELAVEILKGSHHPDLVALVLADLLRYTHSNWSRAIGVDPVEGWQHLLADIESWRTTTGDE